MECGCPIEKSATVCPRCFTPITRLQYDPTMCVSPLCTNEATDVWCDSCIDGVISKCRRFCLFGATTTGLRRHVSLLGQIPISMRGLMHTNTWFSSEVMAAILPRLCSGWEFRLEDEKIISTLDREAAEIEAAGNVVNLPADHHSPVIGKALRTFLLVSRIATTLILHRLTHEFRSTGLGTKSIRSGLPVFAGRRRSTSTTRPRSLLPLREPGSRGVESGTLWPSTRTPFMTLQRAKKPGRL